MPAFKGFGWLKKWIAFSALILLMGGQAAAQAPLEGAYVAWRPDGQYIAVRYEDSLNIVDTDTAMVVNQYQDLPEPAGKVAWSHDGTRLAVVNGADIIVLRSPWDPATAALQSEYRYYLDSPTGQPSFYVDAIAWSPGSTIIANMVGGSIDLWQAINGQRTRILTNVPNIVTDLDWSMDNRLAVGAIQNFTYILNPDTDEVINAYYHGPSDDTVWAVAFSPDGTQLAMGMDYGAIKIWGNTRTSEPLTEMPSMTLSGHRDYVLSIDWNQSGSMIASGSQNGFVTVYDTASGQQIYANQVSANVMITSVAFSPDGTRLAYGVLDDRPVIVPAPVIDPPTATPTPAPTPR
jgi:WD40 repeat protein